MLCCPAPNRHDRLSLAPNGTHDVERLTGLAGTSGSVDAIGQRSAAGDEDLRAIEVTAEVTGGRVAS